MNRITEVTVTKLFGCDDNDYTVKFWQGCPVTFIYGRNGIGKTTLFRLISAVLSYDIKVLESIQFELLKIKFDTEETLSVTKKKLPEFELENDCTEDSDAVSEGNDVISDDNDVMYAYTWEDSNGKTESKVFLNEVDITPCDFPTKNVYVKLWYANPLHDPKVLETAEAENNTDSGESTDGNYICYKVLDRMDDLQRKLKHFKAAGKTYKKRFKLFERIINRKSYFVDKWFTVEDDGEVTLEVRQNEDDWQEGCPLKILSPGEQNLFFLYFQLIFELPKKCPKNGMCLMMIDEPETSLYPERLADFYDNLNYINEELGRYENYQFLIATHSPLIAFRHNRMVTEMATDF